MAYHFYFFSNYCQTSGIIWWKKKVTDNGLMLFYSSHMTMLILDISIPLVSVDLIGKKSQIILECIFHYCLILQI